ncbi:MAG: L-2-hydroxyglutarate oxidase [Candidatus Marinimicrobia bacterium]|nr:L-2-hydroxyglutarate oxidase [Candidatus Neomarinimicrobiota bacterium]
MYDVSIIGAGIVGLATGVKLLEHNPDIKLLVIDKEETLASHQTGHNSGVIHSGIYYKPGSLKARNCRDGIAKLLEFAQEYHVPYELCGKVIVATSEEELPGLADLYERGLANGVPGLELIGPERLAELEPHAAGLQALHSPNTGIIDFSAVAEAYGSYIRANGGEIVLNSKVIGISINSSECIIKTTNGEYKTDKIINCAGLYCDKIARMAGVDPGLKIVPFRGEYYTIRETSHHLVKNLIYPVPDPRFPFLGVHYTRGISGEVEAGPNAVLAFAREGYRKRDFNLLELLETLTYPAFWKMAFPFMSLGLGEMYRSYYKPAFVKALQKLIPEITGDDLAPGEAGVRAQALYNDGRLSDDFAIVRSERMINILNAPSPAATASLEIGESIADIATSIV